jgi:hypothetical protein
MSLPTAMVFVVDKTGEARLWPMSVREADDLAEQLGMPAWTAGPENADEVFSMLRAVVDVRAGGSR